MSLPVYCFGEVLVDMLSSKTTENNVNDTETFTKYAGGAPANVAVAVANLGGNAAHVGAVGDDVFGRFLEEALVSHKVSTAHVKRSKRKTALAFVSLDETGERSFSFYDVNAAHNDFTKHDFATDIFDNPMVFVFGSSMLADNNVKTSTEFALQQVKQKNGISCLDINYRAGFWSSEQNSADIITAAIASVDIIKASKEELGYLFADIEPSDIANSWLNAGTSLVIATDGGNPIEYWTKQHRGTITPPTIDVVDTTAAGDAFVGGLIHQVANQCSDRNQLIAWLENPTSVNDAIQFATQCGAIASSRRGAFPSLPVLEDVVM